MFNFTISELLFEAPFGCEGTPLFNSQVDLAKTIVTYQDSPLFGKKEISVRSSLSLIFSGERSISKALQEALLYSIELRLDRGKLSSLNDIKVFLLDRIQKAYETKQLEKVKDYGDRDYLSLLNATKNGTEFLITTLEPAELHFSEQANKLKNELLEKTAIIQPAEKTEKAKYKFYLPDFHSGRVAREFWDALHRQCVDEHNLADDEADRRLKIASDNGDIEVYLAPLRIVLHSYVFINYSNNRKRRGFCVSYRDANIPSVAELSVKVVFAWFEEYSSELKEIELKTDNEGNYVNKFAYESKY